MSLPIGLAVAPDGLTAVVGEGAGASVHFVPAALAGGNAPSALAVAMEELAERIGEGHGGDGRAGDRSGRPSARVVAALLPPLVETRLLRLPPLAAHEAEEVVRRTAAQHFLSAGAGSVVGVDVPPRSARRAGSGDGPEPVPVLAAAAPRAFTEALYQAVTAVGWELEAIVPAHAAWLAALRGGASGEEGQGAGTPRLVVALAGDTVHLLRTEGGRPAALRRLPASDLAEIAAAAGSGPGRASIFGSGPAANPVLDALLRAGWHAAPKDSGAAAEVAARWAGRAGMELVPPRLAMARRDRVRRAAVWMGAAAVVLLVAAAGVRLWGVSRELDAVRERRAEIRGAVQPVVAIADELWAIEDRLASIEAIQREAGSWTLALVELSVILPESVHLVGLQAAGDTLVVDAVGQRAGAAIDALRVASTLTDIRQEGPIQYEVEDGEVARERFTLSALRAGEAKGSAGATAGAASGTGGGASPAPGGGT